ncbi:MAG: FtsX-like permease family protein [Streptosporangiaceae bacterium]
MSQRPVRGRLRRFLTGPAGPGPAWALALVALLSAFIAVGGPRYLAALQNRALAQTLQSAGQFGISAAISWHIIGVGRQAQFPAAGIDGVGRAIGGQIRPPLHSPPAQYWNGLTTPFESARNAPAGTILSSLEPMLEVAYRSRLPRHARLISGSWPQAAAARRPGQQAVVLQTAVTRTTARRLALRVGSQFSLVRGPELPASDPPVVLKVTGIVRPADPSAAFWTADPALAVPSVLESKHGPRWQTGMFVPPAELAALESAWTQGTVQLQWQYPLSVRALTMAQVPAVTQAMAKVATGAAAAMLAAPGLPAGFGGIAGTPSVSVDGAGVLADFSAEEAAVGATASLLTFGLFAVTLILLMVCALVVAAAYLDEMTLIRARGGSTRQAAARTAARTAAIAGPWLAAGAVLAVLAVPGGGNPASLPLLAVAAAFTLAAPAAAVGWEHRGPRSLAAARRGDVVTRRRSPRQVIAEASLLVAVAGAAVALRQRGLAPGTSDPYISSAPVLVALAAGLVAAWIYPVPLRLLLRVSAARRGAVGYLGIARAARSRPGTVLPALALVVALAVIALGGTIRAAVSRGQVAASWRRVGADAIIQRIGAQQDVGAAAQHAIAAVPGVREACPVYIAPPGSIEAGNLLVSDTVSVSTGVILAEPGCYAGLVARTPWPAFPSPRLLARREPGAAVPVIATPRLAATVRKGADRLAFASSLVTIHVAGTVASTPALPGGGPFVVMPAWATPRFQASTSPDTLLLGGGSIDMPALRAAVRRTLPGGVITSRAAAVQAIADSPAVRGSRSLFLLSVVAGAACCVAAVLLGLLLSGRDRTRLAAWLAALGMTDRQSRRLAFLDALPMVLIAVVGAELAGAVLGQVVGPALDLSVLTSSSASVPVQPDLLALVVPAVGVIALVAAITAGQSLTTRRRAKVGVLRLDEGR